MGPVYIDEPQRASDYVHQICILLGLVVPDPDYCADEENRLTYLIGLLLDNWPGGGGTAGWLLAGNGTGGTEKLGTTTNYSVHIISNNTTRGTLFNSGELGWGLTDANTPLAKFHVRGTGMTSATSAFYFENSASTQSFQGKNDGTWFRNGTLWSLAASNTNISFGLESGQSLTTATYNTFYGNYAGRSQSTGLYNLYLGISAGYSKTGGSQSTFVGTAAGYYNVSGEDNTFIGYDAGYYNTSSRNTFLGTFAGYLSTGADNVAIGNRAGREYLASTGLTTGASNVIVGAGASGSAIADGNHNIMLGYGVGVNTTGDGNILIGGAAGAQSVLTTINNSLAIGYGATPTASNTAVFGSSSVAFTDFYFGGGARSATPGDVSFHPTSAIGTDVAGADLYFAVSQSTGTAASGDIIFQFARSGASGSAINALQTGIFFSGSTGYLSIGTGTLPTSQLVVGDTGGIYFQIDPDVKKYSIGDFGSVNNSTYITIDDAAESISFEFFDLYFNGSVGFTGTGTYTNFTIDNGIIISAS